MAENVVICCAEEDEPALAPIVSVLHAHGCTPEVLAGLDVDPMRLGRFIDGYLSNTLYVLCESDRFRRRSVLQAEGMFGARHAPDDRLIRVLLDTGPEQIANQILTARGGGAQPAPAAPGGARQGVIQREVLGPGSSPSKPSSASNWSKQSAAHRAAAISRAQMAAQEQAEARARGSSGTAPAAGGAAAPPDSFAPKETPYDPSLAPRPEPPPSEADLDVDMDSMGSEDPVEARRETLPPLPAQVNPPGTASTGLVVALVVVAAAAIGWLVLKEQDQGAGERSDRGAPMVQAGTDGAEAEGGAGADETGTSGAEEAAEEEESGLAEQPPVEFKPAEDREALAAAIDAGSLRVLDFLYVATAPLSRLDHEGAEAHCAGLQVGGLSVFRLPSPEEIKRIRKSRMLDRGRFWTNKPAGEGFAYVLDTDKAPSISGGRKKFAGARAVCVRER